MKKTISVCIITKNECSILEGCLKALKPFTDASGHEILVCDTGSSDGTIEMCKRYTDSIYQFEWINDFSAARNHAASCAKNDHIFFIDSDEYITSWDEDNLQKCIRDYPDGVGCYPRLDFCGSGRNAYAATSYEARLYNRQKYHYIRPIHEQIVKITGDAPPEKYFNVEIHADHHAYEGDAATLSARANRNANLLLEEYKKNPHEVYNLFQLGQTYSMLGDFEEALKWYSLALEEDVDPRIGYITTLVTSYGYTLINLNQFEKALELEGIYDTFGDKADFVFLMGMIYMNNGFLEDAIREFEKAISFPTCTVVGANSFRAYHNIGVIYEVTGNTEKAIEYYKKCGDFDPAKERLTALGA